MSKAFGNQQVLKPISFEVRAGERICILGPSGCGKSTLLQLIAGLSPIDGGTVEMDGITVESGRRAVPPEKRPVNMVFQDYALWPHMTVRQNIAYGMKRRKVAKHELNRRLLRLEQMLKLDGLLDRLPAQLSGGQQQRVGIARALATEPKLLLMDEPLSNLDVKLRTDMRGELAQLLGELGIATLYVTHDRMEAFTIADRILVLRDGEIDQLGSPSELFERPASAWVAQLMGYHNRLRAVWTGEPGAVRCGGAEVNGLATAGSGPAGSAAEVLLHPDAVHIADEGAGAGAGPSNVLKTVVAQSIYEGTRWRIIANTDDGQNIHLFHSGPLKHGATAALGLRTSGTLLYPAGTDPVHSRGPEPGRQGNAEAGVKEGLGTGEADSSLAVNG